MAFVPPQFKNFSKNIWGFVDAEWESKKDSPKPFEPEIKVERAGKTADGVKLTTSLSSDPLGKSFKGKLSSDFNLKEVGKVGVELSTEGLKDCAVSVENKNLVKAVVLNLKASNEKVEVKAAYGQESVAVNGSIKTALKDQKTTGTLAVAAGFDGFAAGVQGEFDAFPKAALNDVDAGFTYTKKGQFQVGLNSKNTLGEKRQDITSIGGLYTLDSKTTLGGLLLFRISGEKGFPEDKRWLYAAAERKLDESTTFKAKAELLKDKDLTLSFVHSLKNPGVQFRFSTVVDPLNKFSNKGMAFSASFGN